MGTVISEDNKIYDVFIVGGGINGSGIARDVAGQGMSVMLAEKGDLAGATSSASTKLIHGGLRYLENYEFALVRKALKEREVLLDIAPHIIRPMDFILPHVKSMRPEWMIRAGLFLYDNLGGRKYLKKSRKVKLDNKIIKSDFKTGYLYSDCWVDDARLVVINAMDAHDKGADIRVRTECLNMEADKGLWKILLRDSFNNIEYEVRAKLVVNAAGPWVRDVLENSNIISSKTPNVRLVKGSHIIVKSIFEGDNSYIFQQDDGRVVFAIPYEGEFTLIGTTDVEFKGNASKVDIDDGEIEYLLGAVNKFFDLQIDVSSIVSSYSGVRPLFDDGEGDASEVTRDYHLELDDYAGLDILSVFGGKITTYRKLSEEVVGYIGDIIGKEIVKWTDSKALIGGEGGYEGWNSYKESIFDRYAEISNEILDRMIRQYGTRIEMILDNHGELYRSGMIYEAELRYLIRYEWARSLDDVLWRRTKLGLFIDKDDLPEMADDFNRFLEEELGNG